MAHLVSNIAALEIFVGCPIKVVSCTEAGGYRQCNVCGNKHCTLRDKIVRIEKASENTYRYRSSPVETHKIELGDTFELHMMGESIKKMRDYGRDPVHTQST